MTQEAATPAADREDRLSLLIELIGERPGALHTALQPFARHGVGLTHIESRPGVGRFDFYVDCEGRRGDAAVEAVLAELRRTAAGVTVLAGKDVPWFPRQRAELDALAAQVLDGGEALQATHPGFEDAAYRQRRAAIAQLASGYRHGQPLPAVAYEAQEHATWRRVHQRLRTLRTRYACAEYQHAAAALERTCRYAAGVPDSRAVSAFLQARTGFELRPVAGLVAPRYFLNALAFRVFFATQYVRHHSQPFYTPEPDVCHELLGHAPMFADPAFADLSQEIGLASLGAEDADVERLARCYWYSVEFGLVREGGERKAFGAGLLSSIGELEHALGANSAATFGAWQPEVAAARPYPITKYQPHYFVAESLADAKARMRNFCERLPRPFYARYNAATESIWVDRAVRRQ